MFPVFKGGTGQIERDAVDLRHPGPLVPASVARARHQAFGPKVANVSTCTWYLPIQELVGHGPNCRIQSKHQPVIIYTVALNKWVLRKTKQPTGWEKALGFEGQVASCPWRFQEGWKGQKHNWVRKVWDNPGIEIDCKRSYQFLFQLGLYHSAHVVRVSQILPLGILWTTGILLVL